MPSHLSTPYPVSASGAVGPATPTGFVIVSGVSFAETGGSNPVRVELRDGASATGNVVAVFQVAASGSTPLGDLPNIKVQGGLYVKLTGTGTIEGSVYIR